MGRLEKWLHDIPERTSPLLKAALGHVQFETIHPFLDGNGRVGRLLITLLLCAEGVLREPLLYLSLYLKERRDTYYDLLTRVRADGDWEAWVDFFADGVRESATLAAKTAQRLVARGRDDEEQLRRLGRRAGSALRVHRAFMERPLANVRQLIAATKLSPPAVLKSLDALQEAALVSEITGRRRNRVYRYTPYLSILSEGTRPLG
jgi:Fic family protein